MNNKEKKVIILDNIASPFISQAIIFLKDGTDCEENTILKEAEKIVADYFPKNPPKKSKKLLLGGFLVIVVLAILLIKLFKSRFDCRF